MEVIQKVLTSLITNSIHLGNKDHSYSTNAKTCNFDCLMRNQGS